MMRSILLSTAVAILGAFSVLADQATCSLDSKCPEDSPCCSQYGQCGVGAYCLGGCDPRMSFSLDSCVPEPICESRVFPMSSLDRVVSVSKYLGDPSTADWVYQGEPLIYNGNTLLTMPAESVGTVLATTVYLWYGTIKGRFKTSRGAGVVTAFILLSDVKDEIDYEFVGTELEVAQTNYYFQGIPTYTNSFNISTTDTYNNFHDYEIRWTPDDITWLVDGKIGRTQKKSDTWNATSNQWDFPQSPARLQLSIWPGGADTNAEGTIAWAGGPIDWNSEDIKNYGYDFATFGQVEIECYNATSAPGTNKGTSYYYNNARGTNDTVVDSDKPTILASFLGTGTDMDAGKSSASASASTAASTANTVPGGSSGGIGTNPQAAGGDSGSGSGSSSGGTATTSVANCAVTDFSQSCGTDSSGSTSAAGRVVGGQERIVGTSAFAAVVAFVFLMCL